MSVLGSEGLKQEGGRLPTGRGVEGKGRCLEQRASSNL